MSANFTPGPWHQGGVFDPDSSEPYTNIWGPTPPGKQSGRIVCEKATLPDAKLIAAAPDMFAILDELEDRFDAQTYDARNDFKNFDAPDDREYSVTITAKQLRAIGRALTRAGGGNNDDVRAIANAKLIAAAHDLLAALEAEQEWRDRARDGALDPEWDYEAMVGAKRRAALKKAGA